MNLVISQESLFQMSSRPNPLRVAVVTTAAPPSSNGQARVLGQIIVPKAFATPVYLTDQMKIVEPEGPRHGHYCALSPARFHLTTHPWGRWLGQLDRAGGLARTVFDRASEITAALHRNPVDIVIGCSGNPYDLPAASLAARRLRLPFAAYLFDDPVFQWEAQAYRRAARLAQHIWARRCEAIIVPNEVLAEDIRQRLPRAPIHVVRNPVDLAAFSSPCGPETPLKAPAADAPWRLLYLGSVYSAQADAFRNLGAALAQQQGRFVLDLYTGQFSSDLVAGELAGPYFFAHPPVSHAAATALQQNADVLFLPLAFNSPIPEVIRSSAPAKLGEYLAAGRPILVHAPAGSFVAELIRKAEAGVVVDTPDPRRLAEALTTLSTDLELRTRLVLNAGRLAKEFDVGRTRDAFSAVLSGLRPRPHVSSTA
jgi:glycosyltransferase involved in cell wall biosynthesis